MTTLQTLETIARVRELEYEESLGPYGGMADVPGAQMVLLEGGFYARLKKDGKDVAIGFAPPTGNVESDKEDARQQLILSIALKYFPIRQLQSKGV